MYSKVFLFALIAAVLIVACFAEMGKLYESRQSLTSVGSGIGADFCLYLNFSNTPLCSVFQMRMSTSTCHRESELRVSTSAVTGIPDTVATTDTAARRLKHRLSLNHLAVAAGKQIVQVLIINYHV